LDLEGAYNIRDIGGYPTRDGRTTRWKTLLRADSLHRLPPKSQSALIDYGLRTVIDLRRTEEVRRERDVFADSPDVGYYHQNMLGDEPTDVTPDSEVPAPSAESMAGAYTRWLDLRRTQVCQTLATLATPGILPALVHCAGGKDRTGLIAGLALGLARVPAETIVADYALTARYLIGRHLSEHPPLEAASSDYTWLDYQREYCPAEAMIGTLEHLEDRYGGIEAYVLGGGLTQDQVAGLRSALVE
jgi:protein-tyrosine phosphatase